MRTGVYIVAAFLLSAVLIGVIVGITVFTVQEILG